MPIVASGLIHYWNAKDGIKAGNVLANIAPGQAAKTVSVVGATMQAGGLLFDGVDVYMTLEPNGPWTTVGGSWTMELVLTPRVAGVPIEIAQGSGYMSTWQSATYSDMYVQAYRGNWDLTEEITVVDSAGALRSVGSLLHIAIRFNASTQALQVLINGVQRGTKTLSGNATLAWSTSANFFFRGVYAAAYHNHFHAMRMYNKSLTNAEVSQNYATGADIGLTVARVKIGEFRAHTGDNIPIYSITGHETQPLRVKIPAGVGFMGHVPTNDPAASRIRVRIGGVTRALQK